MKKLWKCILSFLMAASMEVHFIISDGSIAAAGLTAADTG